MCAIRLFIPLCTHLLRTKAELLQFTRNKRNLILDSANPIINPHIVITPPDFIFDGYWAFVQNGVGPQVETNALSVPPVIQGCSTIWPPWQDRHYAWHTAQYARNALPGPSESPYAPSMSMGLGEPKRVFNLARFASAIQSAAQERLVLYHVIPSLHRIHYKAAVILASTIAFEFRRRWDDPGFTAEYEKPFEWTDEAEPLLVQHSRDSSSIILDSPYPCTVPHIIITEAPPQDPFEAQLNNTPNPQDAGYGYYLTVPNIYVDTINVPPPAPSPYTSYDDPYFACSSSEITFSEDEDLEGIYESESGSDEDDSPMLRTPPNLPLEFEDIALSNNGFSGPKSDSLSSSSFEFDDNEDDDEDSLPPFDDWYLNIAQRATQQPC
ncbi:hypothetical protein BXZ70DRAFT_341647 [Cristinia sonorae]|uniref:Uncharacterized protein n=1 Tax=Cristinia sonorae TaxID=1940300 RepID=A0A8K0UKY5_9AGAR|nr:hypothetical protein BXZ70DRAFT_341647 [Cristinia sonorae]